MCRICSNGRGYQLRANDCSIFLPSTLYSPELAETCRSLVNSIERSQKVGEDIKRDVLDALDKLPDFRRRLAEKGLVEEKRRYTLEDLFAIYEAEHDLKPSTIAAKRQSCSVVANRRYFRGQTVDKLTRENALFICSTIVRVGYAPTTQSRITKDLKSVFAYAHKRGLLEENVFDVVKQGSTNNKDKRAYIDAGSFSLLLSACPSRSYRVLYTLARVAGLRCPSECFLLRWKDVDFENGVLRVTSPKTAHQGKSERLVPLFSDVEKELRALLEEVGEVRGDDLVLARIEVRSSAGLSRQFKKHVKAAGLISWAKPFQNLRASCATDVYNAFNAVCESAWLGHSARVSFRHYQQITPDALSTARRTSFLSRTSPSVLTLES